MELTRHALITIGKREEDKMKSVEQIFEIGFDNYIASFDLKSKTCIECGLPLSNMSGTVKTPDGEICSDCHFEMLEKIISNQH